MRTIRGWGYATIAMLWFSVGTTSSGRADDRAKPAATSAATRVALAQALFSDFCAKSKICVRLKSSYADVRPDRCITSGSGQDARGQEVDCPRASGSISGSQLASSVAMLASDPNVPKELLEGVYGYLQARNICGPTTAIPACIRFAWITESQLRADESDDDADPNNTVTVVGVRSVLGDAVARDAPGTTVAMVGRTTEVTDLEDEFLINRFKTRLASQVKADPAPKIDQKGAAISFSYDSPAELAMVSANVRTERVDALNNTKKFFRTEWIAMDKAGVQAQLQLIQRESREAWKVFWMQKLQAKTLDEVAEYLLLQSKKQLERNEVAAAHASVASLNLLLADLSPKVQSAVTEMFEKTKAALAAELKRKQDQLQAEEKAAEEQRRAHEAAMKKRMSPKEQTRRQLCYATGQLRRADAALRFEDEVSKTSGVTDLKLRHDLGEQIVALKRLVQAATPTFAKLYKRPFAEQTDCVEAK